MAEYINNQTPRHLSQQIASTMTISSIKSTASTTTSQNKFHIIAKKKLEKIKNKFTEFFLSSSTTSTPNKNNRKTSLATAYNSNSSILSQSIISINDFEESKNEETVMNNNSNNNHRYKNKVIAHHDLSYIPHTAFLFTNIKKLMKFHSQYHNSSDDEDFQINLFDRVFMIDYIAFKLINEFKISELINKFHLDLRIPYYKNEFNLIYRIAKHIYLESESEPMGLNGLNLIIELELNDLQTKQSQQKQQETSIITNIHFNPTSTLTTFELKLVLKEDSNIICLRKFLPKTKLFDKLRIQSAIYLDSKYTLIKKKLY